MGTRIEDQPPEHWAGPESLDPTPVWKQFALIGIFLLLGLLLLTGVAVFAAAPQLVTPPALVAGDRLVLVAADLPPVGSPPNGVGPPVVDDGRRIWLVRASPTDAVAFRAWWSPTVGGPECPVALGGVAGSIGYIASCERTSGRSYTFDAQGNAPSGGAYRSLDRYLVSVSDDRVIVNLSRLIMSAVRTSAPPTP